MFLNDFVNYIFFMVSIEVYFMFLFLVFRDLSSEFRFMFLSLVIFTLF